MFLRNEMKFLIISLFLATAASLGMASPELFPLQVYTDAVTKTGPDPIISALEKLSPECQAGLLSIISSTEFFKCVPAESILPLLPAVTDPNALQGLLKDPIHTLPPLLTPVFDAVCADPKCSDEWVSGALKAVEDGCKKDADNPLIQIITGVITFYSPIRDTICFKTNKNEYCVFDTLEKILSLPKPPITITGGFLDNIVFAEPKEICTPCNKAIVNTIFNFLNADTNHSVELLAKLGVSSGLLSIAKLGVAAKCGFQFLDGDVGHPETTDPDDFNYQLSLPQGVPVPSGASNVKEISLMTMIGAFLVSTLMI